MEMKFRFDKKFETRLNNRVDWQSIKEIKSIMNELVSIPPYFSWKYSP